MFVRYNIEMEMDPNIPIKRDVRTVRISAILAINGRPVYVAVK